MAWYKVDDKLHSHPKARRAGLAAMGLWALAGSHCMDYLTEGVVESWFVESWPDGPKLAAKLVKVGMWDEHPEGWVFHDWSEYQPTREKVLSEREATRARVAKWRNGVTNGVSTASPSPSPSPSPDTTYVSESSHVTYRANENETAKTVLANGFKVDPDKIVAHLRQRTDRDVGYPGALRIVAWLLDKGRDVKNPQGYVLSSITKSWAEVQKYIDEEGVS